MAATSALAFAYDDGLAQVQQAETGPNANMVVYLTGPGVYAERQTWPSGAARVDWYDYIMLAGGLAGEVWSSTAAAAQLWYFHGDAQGTVTAITGSAAETDSYDPWDKERCPSGAPDNGGASVGGNCPAASKAARHSALRPTSPPRCGAQPWRMASTRSGPANMTTTGRTGMPSTSSGSRPARSRLCRRPAPSTAVQ
ncbi:MAG TPA: hypothetical protein VKS60_00990 [Stellaceae bacterium]|nr:hypothetical protein [Stellaceae bacterium]